jgi:SAM-dependent methyltransferase
VHWTKSYFEQAYPKRWGLGPPSAATHAEAAHLLTLLSPPPEVPLLDVACGHGRYTVALASLRHRVVGLDASRALLDLATRQTASVPVPPLWVLGDMRRLPFAPRFGGALLLDSFGFFDQDDDNALVLRELRRILLPKGRLIVAVANAAPILATFRSRDVERRGSVVVEIDRTLQRHPAQLVETLTVREAGESKHYERRQRLYSRAELTALAEAAAFVVLAVFADYMGAAFDEAASPKLVILAQGAA